MDNVSDVVLSAGEAEYRIEVAEGEVEVCCHRVSFWYNVPKRLERTEELKATLTEHAVGYVEECIINGEWCGGLECYYSCGDEKDVEIDGWWEIE